MNTETIMVLRSGTHTVKAKKVLASHGINARQLKIPPADGRGCAYGIALAAKNADKAAGILIDNGINIISIKSGE